MAMNVVTGDGDFSARHRSAWVDIAKGIGILLVVYGHVARGLQSSEIIDGSGLFIIIDRAIYSFHMPLFFFLSGLVFYDALVRRGPKLFIASKVDTILWPYVLWSLMQGVIEVSVSSHTNGGADWSQVLAFPYEPRAQFWFLYVLFLIATISAVVYSRLSPRLFGAVFFVGVGAYVLQGLASGPTFLIQVIQNFAYFALGIWLMGLKESPCSGFSITFISIIFAVALEIVYLANYGKADPFSYIINISTGVACIAFVCLVSNLPGVGRYLGGALGALGRGSMSIYLMHIIVGSGARIILQRGMGVDSLVIHLFVGVLAGLLVPVIIERVIVSRQMTWLLRAPSKISLERLLRRT